MIALLAATMIAQATPAGAHPADARLDAFRAACVPHRQDLAAAAEAMQADGWVPAVDADHPELASTMAVVRAEMVDPELEMIATFDLWRKAHGTAVFHVVLTRVDAVLRAEDHDDDGDGVLQSWERRDVMTQLGCGLWDFDATGPIDANAVTAWVGAPPVQTIDAPGVVQGGTWSVYDIMPGTGEIHVGFIPDGGIHFDRTGFSGVSLTMSSATRESMEAYLRSQAEAAPDDGVTGGVDEGFEGDFGGD